jgi:hypothetical protein
MILSKRLKPEFICCCFLYNSQHIEFYDYEPTDEEFTIVCNDCVHRFVYKITGKCTQIHLTEKLKHNQ